MAARGTTAKTNVENKIKEAFGEDFVCIQDKKLYVWAQDENERVQIAITLTCPKVFVGDETATRSDGLDFENMAAPATTAATFQPAEITNEETENIKKMLTKLGL